MTSRWRALAERLANSAQEARELGLAGTAYRVAHEVRQRTGLAAALAPRPDAVPREVLAWGASAIARSPFEAPDAVIEVMRGRIAPEAHARLVDVARDAAHGRILCFGRWTGDYGEPLDWQRNPTNGARWDPTLHWSRALVDAARVGDVKLTWEAARFPQAFHLARAATFARGEAGAFNAAFLAQLDGFLAGNPAPLGVHWASGQELVIRLVAWHFALGTFARLGVASARDRAARFAAYAYTAAAHLAREIHYAERAVYNNHLITEALGLYLAAWLLPDAPDAARWERIGTGHLRAQAERQFYPDGAYINLSHTYHRVVLQDYLLYTAVERARGRKPATEALAAMERSLDFLVAHQNPADGRLPNFGSNDGSMPRVLSTCDFADFRPVLQAVAVATRGERIYDPGPWDEEAAWVVGARALHDARVRPPARRSVSFAHTGFDVLRSAAARGNFGAFRCGSLRDRFAQVDMLHLDVFFRGHNVLIDGGSYLYNGPPRWHEHFVRTAIHNTVELDGRDQMLHFRRFKFLYWTRARRLAFVDHERFALTAGEHYGYARYPGGCVHRRSVLFVKDDLWVVVDRIEGAGAHDVRLHWLLADLPWACDPSGVPAVTLETPGGPFSLGVWDAQGRAMPATVARGVDDGVHARGWSSRYYAEKSPTPSLAVLAPRAALPMTLITAAGAGRVELVRAAQEFRVRADGCSVAFGLRDGLISAESVRATRP